MTTERIVPVAYVTKWAATRGILVLKGATWTAGDALYRHRPRDQYALYIPKAHWTEDRAVAEQRWRKALENKRMSHEKAIAKIKKALAGEPPFTGET